MYPRSIAAGLLSYMDCSQTMLYSGTWYTPSIRLYPSSQMHRSSLYLLRTLAILLLATYTYADCDGDDDDDCDSSRRNRHCALSGGAVAVIIIAIIVVIMLCICCFVAGGRRQARKTLFGHPQTEHGIVAFLSPGRSEPPRVPSPQYKSVDAAVAASNGHGGAQSNSNVGTLSRGATSNGNGGIPPPAAPAALNVNPTTLNASPNGGVISNGDASTGAYTGYPEPQTHPEYDAPQSQLSTHASTVYRSPDRRPTQSSGYRPPSLSEFRTDGRI
ncbi:hypothetical protein PLICRDRAFT_488770 [Plicaturopsis crispa FD-325 SS-3]|nr:hypothetical protein PLICRDRAFT_488770 [Plicaturopsis crispa FD-325 SS-3]